MPAGWRADRVRAAPKGVPSGVPAPPERRAMDGEERGRKHELFHERQAASPGSATLPRAQDGRRHRGASPLGRVPLQQAHQRADHRRPLGPHPGGGVDRGEGPEERRDREHRGGQEGGPAHRRAGQGGRGQRGGVRSRWLPLPRAGRRRGRRGPGSGIGVLMAQDTQFEERAVGRVNRVAKVVKGGRRFSFAALMVIGDGNGQVGLGYGKAKEAGLAMAKAIEEAKKNVFSVPLAGSTITHEILGEAGAGRVLLKPAAPGTGVIAGGAARAILEVAGIHDVLAKSLGSSNMINVAHATIAGLKSLKRPDEIARLRGLSPEEVTPKGLLEAYRETQRGGHVPTEVA